MILEIQHETRLAYSEPVTESVAEVRMEPVSDAQQTCRSYHLAVTPPTTVSRFVDGFRNSVDHFNVLPPHKEIRILAASVVETYPRPEELEGCSAMYPPDPSRFSLELLDFLSFRGPVRHNPKLEPIVQQLYPLPGTRIAEVVLRVSGYIRQNFKYARHVTLASSPIDDVLTHGKGVCQDFTHLMIAILRSFGIPARYVSGYIHGDDAASQSHAWCEVWLTGMGWVGIDPANDHLIDERFVKVAIGRDFTDVPPNKGLYRGKAEESISVRVETRKLEALPSLSWRQQLPPLHVPLTAIVSGRKSWELSVDDDVSQQ